MRTRPLVLTAYMSSEKISSYLHLRMAQCLIPFMVRGTVPFHIWSAASVDLVPLEQRPGGVFLLVNGDLLVDERAVPRLEAENAHALLPVFRPRHGQAVQVGAALGGWHRAVDTAQRAGRRGENGARSVAGAPRALAPFTAVNVEADGGHALAVQVPVDGGPVAVHLVPVHCVDAVVEPVLAGRVAGQVFHAVVLELAQVGDRQNGPALGV